MGDDALATWVVLPLLFPDWRGYVWGPMAQVRFASACEYDAPRSLSNNSPLSPIYICLPTIHDTVKILLRLIPSVIQLLNMLLLLQYCPPQPLFYLLFLCPNHLFAPHLPHSPFTHP